MEEKKCSICEKKHYAKGYCRNHYGALRRRGSPHAKLLYIKNKGMTCKVEGCNAPAYLKGACNIHYYRWRNTGSYEKRIYRGKLHHSWKGGVSDYPGHYTLKKNRLIKLREVDSKCEDCGAHANQVIRKDGSNSNHAVENLKAVCLKCKGKNSRKHGTSKYKKLYGKSVVDMAKEKGVSETTLYVWLSSGRSIEAYKRKVVGRPKKVA